MKSYQIDVMLMLLVITWPSAQTAEPDIVLLYNESGYATCAVGSRSQNLIVDIFVDSQQHISKTDIQVEYEPLSRLKNEIIQCNLTEDECKLEWNRRGFAVRKSFIYNRNQVDERWQRNSISMYPSLISLISESFVFTISLLFKTKFSMTIAVHKTTVGRTRNYVLNVERQHDVLMYVLKDCGYSYCNEIKCISTSGNAATDNWIHINIIKISNLIKFEQFEVQKNSFETVCVHQNRESVKFEYIIINEDGSNLIKWKLQEYEAILLNNPNGTFIMEPLFIANHYFCASFYVLLTSCPNCTLYVSIMTEDGSATTIATKLEFENNWQKVRIEKAITGKYRLKLHILNTKPDYTSLIIDGIRQCYHDEVRYVTAYVGAQALVSCHILQDPRWNVSKTELHCPKDKYCRNKQFVGSGCDVRCPQTYGDYCAPNTIICENTRQNNTCYCAPTLHNSQAIPNTPLGLGYRWTDNQLVLMWEYPDVTDNQIYRFLVQLNAVQSEFDLNEVKNYRANVNTTDATYYTHTVSEKLHPSTSYEITVNAVNIYLGKAAKIKIDVAPTTPIFIGNLEDVTVSNTTATIRIPGVEKTTLNKNSWVCVLVTEEPSGASPSVVMDKNTAIKPCLIGNHVTELQWVAAVLQAKKETVNLTLGDNTTSLSLNRSYGATSYNKPLKPATKYTVTVIPINNYHKENSFNVYQLQIVTLDEAAQENTTYSSSYVLFLLFLLPVLVWIVHKYHVKKNSMMVLHSGDSLVDSDVVFSAFENKVCITETEENDNWQLVNSKLVPIDEFETYLKQSTEQILADQHASFQKGPTKPWVCGISAENKSKNRYKNICAYDHNRVKLQNGDKSSDYINASYINGYEQINAYIATQGPKSSTVDDFWRMVWQEKSQNIVMITNLIEEGKKKCEKYWPDLNETQMYGAIHVQHIKTMAHDDYIIRTFEVTNNNEVRKIEQLHFTSWPDHGEPLYPLTLKKFLKEMFVMSPNSTPVTVHCSAGVGRTGTIILTHICLQMAIAEQAVDVLRYLQELREQRVNMVDNVDQYKLVHFLILEYLCTQNTNIQCNENTSEVIANLLETNVVDKEMKYLQATSWRDDALVPEYLEEFSKYSEMNRFENVVPNKERIVLATEHDQTYINAVHVDGFKVKNGFIVTQNPLPSTVFDFWMMVQQEDVKLIVSLNEFSDNDQTCIQFWSTEVEIKLSKTCTLKCLKAEEFECYNCYSLSLISSNKWKTKNRTIELIQLKNWFPAEKLPKNRKQLIELWIKINTLFEKCCSIVVTCYDGATACGYFIAVSYIIEMIKTHQCFDICQIVRVIRRNRKQFIKDQEQYESLYKVAGECQKMFDIYTSIDADI